MSIEYWEWEELAANILDMPEEQDAEEIEQQLLNEYGLDLEGFGRIAQKLLDRTMPTMAQLSGTPVQSYVQFTEPHVEGAVQAIAIVKQPFIKQ